MQVNKNDEEPWSKIYTVLYELTIEQARPCGLLAFSQKQML